MLEPLTQFYCDTCGEIINNPKEGMIEWISQFNDLKHIRENHSFRIVHHYNYSPLAVKNETQDPLSSKYNNGCYQHNNSIGRSDMHLHQFLDENYKMANILKFLDAGPIHVPEFKGSNLSDIREYIEIVRRLTIPHYEEARRYWGEAHLDGFFDDANETWIYGVKNLKYLIEKYGDK